MTSKRLMLVPLLAGGLLIFGFAPIGGSVGAGASTAQSESPDVTSVSSLTNTPVSCNGYAIRALTPSPGQGMPVAELLGQSSGTVPNHIQSSATKWIVPKCKQGARHLPTIPPTGVSPDNVPATGPFPYLNWAGFVASSVTYTQAEQQWTVPKIAHDDTQTSTPDASIWPGLGTGLHDNNLLAQAGTEELQTAPQEYYAWYELYPYQPYEQEIENFPVEPDDQVFVAVQHSGSGQALILINDETQSDALLFYTTWPSQYTIGTQAEWILERAESDGNLDELAKVGTLQISKANGITGGKVTPLGSLDREYYYMQECNGSAYIAKTGDISSSGTSFPITWYGYGGVCPY